MKTGRFDKPKHKALVALYYYSGVRKTEATRALKEQFRKQSDLIIFDVGVRLKHGKHTPPLVIPMSAPYANYIWAAVEHTAPGARVFPYCPRTAYNVVHRAFKYPHYFRLSRITNFFSEGYTITQVKSWTGLTLTSLDFYVGIVDVNKMGIGLNKFGERPPAPRLE